MENKSKLYNILHGVIYIFAGIFVINHPKSTLHSIALIFSVAILINGLINIFEIRENKKITDYIMAVISVLIGAYMIFNLKTASVILPLVYAFWFLEDCILSLFSIQILKQFNKKLYNIMLVINIINLLFAIMLLFNPLSAILLPVYIVGINLIIIGVKHFMYLIAK